MNPLTENLDSYGLATTLSLVFPLNAYMHLSNKYFLSTCYMPDVVLDLGIYIVLVKIYMVLASMELSSIMIF